MRGLWGAKKKERHKSHSGTDQNKYNCNVAKFTEKGIVFSLLSTRSCSKCIYTLCVTGSEPWALALWASCCIQIRTEAFTSLSSEVEAGASQPRSVSAVWGFPLLFQYTVKWDNWHCRWLILICLPLHKEWGGESQFHGWNWLVLWGYFP